MNENNSETLNLINDHIHFALSSKTSVGVLNSSIIMNRKKSPFWELADKICKNLRKNPDIYSLMLCEGFLNMYNKNILPTFSKRLVDEENINLFKMYYYENMPKEKVMEEFGLEDERTLYKKLKRSRELFAIAIYDFCMFINK